MDKKKYKIISTIVSLTIYSVILLLVLNQSAALKFSSKKQKPQEEIFVDLTALEVKSEKIVEQKEIIEEQVAKKKPPQSVKNLFSDINETFDESNLFKDKAQVLSRKPPKKISVDALFEAKPLPRINSKNIIKNLDTPQSTTTLTAISSEGVSDEYFSKIQEILARGWYPKADQKGMTATLLIKIDTDGTFDFYIKGVSGDQGFLGMLKQHMQKLQQQGLPKPKKTTSVTINFIAKE